MLLVNHGCFGEAGQVSGDGLLGNPSRLLTIIFYPLLPKSLISVLAIICRASRSLGSNKEKLRYASLPDASTSSKVDREIVKSMNWQKRGNILDSLIGYPAEEPTVEKYEAKAWRYQNKIYGRSQPSEHEGAIIPLDESMSQRQLQEMIFRQPIEADLHTPAYLSRKMENASRKRKLLLEEDVKGMRLKAEKNRQKAEEDSQRALVEEDKSWRASKKQKIWERQKEGKEGKVQYGWLERRPRRPIVHNEKKYLLAAQKYEKMLELLPNSLAQGKTLALELANSRAKNRRRLSAIKTGDRKMHDEIIVEYLQEQSKRNYMKQQLDDKYYRHNQKAKGWNQRADSVEVKKKQLHISKKRKAVELSEQDLPEAKRQANSSSRLSDFEKGKQTQTSESGIPPLAKDGNTSNGATSM